MAHPMMKFPTLGEFIQKTTEGYGATLRTTTSPVTGPRGPVVFRYLERQTGEGVRRTTPLPEFNDRPLPPDVLRSFIVQLDLPPADFGYDLGLPGTGADDSPAH